MSRPRTSTTGPSARASVPSLGAMPPLGNMPTPRTAAMTPRVSTPEAGTGQGDMDSRFVADTLRNNQAMQQELTALRQMLGQMKSLKAELAEEKRTSAALESEVAALRVEYDKCERALRDERNAKEAAVANAEAAQASAVGGSGALAAESAKLAAANDTIAELTRGVDEARATATAHASQIEQLKAAVAQKDADFADHNERTARQIDESIAAVEKASKAQVAAMARAMDDASKAAEASAAEQQAEHDGKLETLLEELVACKGELAVFKGRVKCHAGSQTRVPMMMSAATACDIVTQPAAATPHSLTAPTSPVARACDSLEAAYREFLAVCDEFNCSVDAPGQDATLANTTVAASNKALGALLERVDRIVNDAGPSPPGHVRQYADCLQHAIVTTTSIHAYAGQGLVLEYELGDDAFNDHESTMLIALRRVVRSQLRESTRPRISRSPSYNADL